MFNGAVFIPLSFSSPVYVARERELGRVNVRLASNVMFAAYASSKFRLIFFVAVMKATGVPAAYRALHRRRATSNGCFLPVFARRNHVFLRQWIRPSAPYLCIGCLRTSIPANCFMIVSRLEVTNFALSLNWVYFAFFMCFFFLSIIRPYQCIVLCWAFEQNSILTFRDALSALTIVLPLISFTNENGDWYHASVLMMHINFTKN